MTSPEQLSRIRFDSKTGLEYGQEVLEALTAAVQKQVRLRKAEAKLAKREAVIHQANCLSRPMLTAWLKADDIKTHRQAQYDIRHDEAEAYVEGDIEISVFSLDGEALVSGILKHVDYPQAYLAVETPEGESTVVDFSQRRQLPDSVSERYFGHEAIAQLRVDAISADNSQLFEPLPHL